MPWTCVSEQKIRRAVPNQNTGTTGGYNTTEVARNRTQLPLARSETNHCIGTALALGQPPVSCSGSLNRPILSYNLIHLAGGGWVIPSRASTRGAVHFCLQPLHPLGRDLCMGNDAKVLLHKTAFKTLPLLIVLDFDPRAHRPRRGQHRELHLICVGL